MIRTFYTITIALLHCYVSFALNGDTLKTYYPGGQLQSVGMVENGKPEGIWKTYYPNGQLKSVGNRKNHQLNGLWIFFDYEGDTTKKINYLDGKRNGYYNVFYSKNSDKVDSNSVREKSLYVNDKINGEKYTFFPCGGLMLITNYINGEKDGYEYEYSSDGRIITVLRYRKNTLIEQDIVNRYSENNSKTGTWKEFYKNRNVKSSIEYKNGIINGLYKRYNEKGELISSIVYKDGKISDDQDNFQYEVDIKEIFYDNGNLKFRGGYIDKIPVGIHNRYSIEGNVIETIIYNEKGVLTARGIITKDGKRVGDWKYYHENNEIAAEGKYNNNLRDGEWRFYYKNKKLEQKGKYSNGKKNGSWIWYYTNGDIWKEEEFYNGRNEGLYTEYNGFGEIIVEGAYFDGEKEGEWMVKVGDHIEKGKYVTGFKDGVWKHYYTDGSLRFEGEYIQGNAEGKHKYLYPNGIIKREEYYNAGIRVKHWKKYDELGNLIITITYKNNNEFRINGHKVEFINNDIIRLN